MAATGGRRGHGAAGADGRNAGVGGSVAGCEEGGVNA
jgi:hypothetical protein